MIAALRFWLLAVWLRALAASHQWRAYECESYLAACARDGLVDSLSVRDWRMQAVTHRAQQVALQRRLHDLTAQRARAAARPA